MQKKYFAGANTPGGFYSLFDNILPLEKTKRKIYIKGGSGTGKSTLIRKTAEFYAGRGYGDSTEFFFCSNDAESLDGVCVPELGIAAVDATSPHPADPKIPVAIDEIFNAADFLDKDYIKSKKELLFELYTEKKALYDRAYGYLKAAQEIYKLNNSLYESAVNKTALRELTVELMKLIGDEKPAGKNASDRALFATAITPEGVKSLIGSALQAQRVYILQGFAGMGIAEVLSTLQKSANLLGFDTISFKSPLEPVKTEHLLVGNIAFVTSNRYHGHEGTSEINFTELMRLEKYKDEINYNNEMFDRLLQKAIDVMAASKERHLQTEAIYAEGMDFKRMSRAFDKVLENEA